MKAIVNGKIIKENKIVLNKVLVFDNKIEGIVSYEEFDEYVRQGNIAKGDLRIIDAKNNYVSPGLIDIHIHGSGGHDTMDGNIEALKGISRTIAEYGVTSFLPTTMTMEKEKIYEALQCINQAKYMKMPGAGVLGAHMEGPFISAKLKGAHKEEYILKPDFDFIREFADTIKIVTMAPEEDENFKFIKETRCLSDITLSIGHTNASYEVAIDAIDNGIEHATHTFNAMTALNHRSPGVVGAIFNSHISCELIADNIHIHPEMYKLLLKIKGEDKVVLITDSMRAGGMKNGIYELGGQRVIVKDKCARLEDSTLAGSVLTLNTAVKNILEHTELTIPEAVSLATINPAKVIHVDRHKGSIETQKDSDIIIFNDQLEVLYTIVEGEIVYLNNELRSTRLL